MEKNYEFGGITFKGEPNGIEETFDLLFDNGTEVAYESKRVYEHREEGLNFDYHYLIETNETDNGILCSVSLVLHKASLSEKALNGVLDLCGIDEGEVNSQDINDYGCSVCFGSCLRNFEDMEETLNCAAHIIGFLETMFGFYLDKKVNYSDNGWDWIRKFI